MPVQENRSNESNYSRRKFMKAAGVGAVGGLAGGAGLARATAPDTDESLRRNVRVGAVTLERISSETPEGSVEQMYELLDEMMPKAEPDIVCLPEAFNTMRSDVSGPYERVAEPVPGPTTERLGELAQKYSSYLIVPITVRDQGEFYNSAPVIDRSGDVIGRYDKMYPTAGETNGGKALGEEAPVFETDFGKIGVQTCFDINWSEGWQQLYEQGADIVFWPSAYPGGQWLNMKAMEYEYVVVPASRWNPSRVIDITGETIESSGRHRDWVCATVNLEKGRFKWASSQPWEKVQEEYGKKVGIEWYHDENFWVLESKDPQVTVEQLRNEFDLVTRRERMRNAEEVYREQGYNVSLTATA